jgi:hypothetical protein
MPTRDLVTLAVMLASIPATAGELRERAMASTAAVPRPSCRLPFISPRRVANRVRTVVRRYIPRIRNCYQLELQADWNREGTLAAQWFITADGAVMKAAVTGAAENTALAACVTEVIATMRFGPGDAILVRYPFTFAVGARTWRARAEAGTLPEPLPHHLRSQDATPAVPPPITRRDTRSATSGSRRR